MGTLAKEGSLRGRSGPRVAWCHPVSPVGPGAGITGGVPETRSSRDTLVIMQSPSSGPAVASSRRFGIFPTVGGSTFALAVLFSMNLLNYVDRYSFFAVGTHVKDALHIKDARLGVLNSS